MKGDCFQAALHAAQVFWEKGAEAYVCHGQPLYRGGPERMWHGWVELYRGDGMRLAVDTSNGKELAVPRGRYYRIGGLRLEDVLRFDASEAVEAMLTWRHYGPWSDAWDDEDRGRITDLQNH